MRSTKRRFKGGSANGVLLHRVIREVTKEVDSTGKTRQDATSGNLKSNPARSGTVASGASDIGQKSEAATSAVSVNAKYS